MARLNCTVNSIAVVVTASKSATGSARNTAVVLSAMNEGSMYQRYQQYYLAQKR